MHKKKLLISILLVLAVLSVGVSPVLGAEVDGARFQPIQQESDYGSDGGGGGADHEETHQEADEETPDQQEPDETITISEDGFMVCEKTSEGEVCEYPLHVQRQRTSREERIKECQDFFDYDGNSKSFRHYLEYWGPLDPQTIPPQWERHLKAHRPLCKHYVTFEKCRTWSTFYRNIEGLEDVLIQRFIRDRRPVHGIDIPCAAVWSSSIEVNYRKNRSTDERSLQMFIEQEFVDGIRGAYQDLELPEFKIGDIDICYSVKRVNKRENESGHTKLKEWLQATTTYRASQYKTRPFAFVPVDERPPKDHKEIVLSLSPPFLADDPTLTDVVGFQLKIAPVRGNSQAESMEPYAGPASADFCDTSSRTVNAFTWTEDLDADLAAMRPRYAPQTSADRFIASIVSKVDPSEPIPIELPPPLEVSDEACEAAQNQSPMEQVQEAFKQLELARKRLSNAIGEGHNYLVKKRDEILGLYEKNPHWRTNPIIPSKDGNQQLSDTNFYPMHTTPVMFEAGIKLGLFDGGGQPIGFAPSDWFYFDNLLVFGSSRKVSRDLASSVRSSFSNSIDWHTFFNIESYFLYVDQIDRVIEAGDSYFTTSYELPGDSLNDEIVARTYAALLKWDEAMFILNKYLGNGDPTYTDSKYVPMSTLFACHEPDEQLSQDARNQLRGHAESLVTTEQGQAIISQVREHFRIGARVSLYEWENISWQILPSHVLASRCGNIGDACVAHIAIENIWREGNLRTPGNSPSYNDGKYNRALDAPGGGHSYYVLIHELAHLIDQGQGLNHNEHSRRHLCDLLQPHPDTFFYNKIYCTQYETELNLKDDSSAIGHDPVFICLKFFLLSNYSYMLDSDRENPHTQLGCGRWIVDNDRDV